jgi:hypothetical protein
MSNRLSQPGGMKSSNSSWLGLSPVETIARFGAARLVRNLDGIAKQPSINWFADELPRSPATFEPIRIGEPSHHD